MRDLYNSILKSCEVLSAFLLVTTVAAVVQRDVNTQLITPATDQNLTWGQTAIFYQVYPRSFKGSNGDGVGDIQGLKFINFVPGHVSSDHEWFRRSAQRDGKYTNYFVWSDGKLLDNGTRVPPNNWLSVFGDSAWQWNDERQQYYYHAFDPHQVDLNYRDENLQREIKDTFRFWFQTEAFSKLFENENTSLDKRLSGNDVPQIESPAAQDYSPIRQQLLIAPQDRVGELINSSFIIDKRDL